MRGALVVAVLFACKSKEAPPPPKLVKPPEPTKPAEPAKVVHAASVEEGFVVVVPKGRDAAAIEKQMRDHFAAAKLVGGIAAMDAPPMSPEDREVLAQTNPELTPADLDGIIAGKAIGLTATGEPIATLRAIAPIVRDGAVAAHGWILDPLAGGVYTAAQFGKHVPGDVIDVRKVIYVHSVEGDGQQPYLDTMGMRKLGFPELSVSVAASGQTTLLTQLIDGAAQTMLAHPELAVPGAIDIDFAALPGDWPVDELRARGGSGRAHLRTEWHHGDSSDLEIELVPPGGTGTEGVAALLDSCFGKVPDPIAKVGANDPELEAAARRARSELTAMRAHFAKGVPFKESLAVKAPFTAEDGRVEWMWVDVVAWKGDSFEGSLDNDPDWVKSLHAGSPVTVPLAKVADFVLVRADGTQTGGYSVEILKKREGLR